MTNYPDIEDRLQRLEHQIAVIQKKLDEIVQWIRNLEEQVEPAVTTQRIRDEWDVRWKMVTRTANRCEIL